MASVASMPVASAGKRMGCNPGKHVFWGERGKKGVIPWQAQENIETKRDTTCVM